MQISNEVRDQMKAKLKYYYPQGYALKVVEKLVKKGRSTSRQQVYNFFNGLGVRSRNEIINSAVELIQEARENNRTLERTINEN